MCCGCWKEDGAHQIDNAKVRRIASLYGTVEEFGALHVVVDDDNLETETIELCRFYALAAQVDEYGDPAWTDSDQAMYEALMDATFEERVSAAGLNNGCWQTSAEASRE